MHPAFVDNPGVALNAGFKMFNGKPTVEIDPDHIIGVQNNKYARVFYTASPPYCRKSRRLCPLLDHG